MQKTEALRVGKENLYNLIESYEEALGLVDTLEALTELSKCQQTFLTFLQTAAIYKAFADKVWGEKARATLLEVWGGDLGKMMEDFWDKPSKEIQERVAAAKWANSLEGISDLRRFWGIKPSEVTTDELSAFQHTLPSDAASSLAYSSFKAPLSEVMSARQADYMRLRLRQAAGKSGSLPESESMIAALRKDRAFGKDSEKTQELIKREREYQKQLKAEKRKNLESQ